MHGACTCVHKETFADGEDEGGRLARVRLQIASDILWNNGGGGISTRTQARNIRTHAKQLTQTLLVRSRVALCGLLSACSHSVGIQLGLGPHRIDTPQPPPPLYSRRGLPPKGHWEIMEMCVWCALIRCGLRARVRERAKDKDIYYMTRVFTARTSRDCACVCVCVWGMYSVRGAHHSSDSVVQHSVLDILQRSSARPNA